MHPTTRAALTLERLIGNKVVPEHGNFDITEYQLDCFVKVYDRLAPSKNEKATSLKGRINYPFARKMWQLVTY